MVICVLLRVVFITLFERKILSYIGYRKGPNKVSFLGYLQAIGDSLKLFSKQIGHPWVSNIFIYWFSPILIVLILIFSWRLLFFLYSLSIYSLGVVGFLCVSSLGVYVLLSSGWRSKNKYTVIGSLRGACQSISYEVSLIFFLLIPFIYLGSLKFSWVWFRGVYGFIFIGLFSLVVIWVFICVCETNRSPFDFSEGERELVSGFKVEYGALQFAFLYLGEYGMIVFFSYFTSLVFFRRLWPFSKIFCLFIIFFYIWIRGTLPRFRYDLLMEMAWMVLLPLVMFWLIFILIL